MSHVKNLIILLKASYTEPDLLLFCSVAIFEMLNIINVFAVKKNIWVNNCKCNYILEFKNLKKDLHQPFSSAYPYFFSSKKKKKSQNLPKFPKISNL